MRLCVLIVAILFAFLCKSGLAQTKKETIKWLNNTGEEYLRDITGNPSIYWELDNNGTLKITNYKITNDEKDKIIKRYIYLNLYQLDSEKSLLIEEKVSEKGLLLRCKLKANNCIKSRSYYTDSDFKVSASPLILFDLKNSFDVEKGKKLENKLILAIQFISGKFAGSS